MSIEDDIQRWANEAPTAVDLTKGEQDLWARSVADALVASGLAADALVRLEEANTSAPVLLRLAMKLAQSRVHVLALQSPFRISVVFAVYKEHNRLRTKAEHPHGEDSLVRKVDQIEWLLRGIPGATWEMLVVDDGCPEHSGDIAQQIVDEHGFGDRVRVLFLRDAIADDHPSTRGLTSTDDSQKGGSIQYGMSVASADGDPRHVVVFTDADLSTHLGQLGLLVDPILTHDYSSAIGSRREPLSIVIKGGARNTRGKLFIYLWKRVIPTLSPIVDTQCGFKGFRADIARQVVDDAIEKRFAFDIELLVRTELLRAGSIERVPIAWIDSEAASTTTELQPYLPMLQSVIRIGRRYLTMDTEADAFAELIASLDEASWTRLSSDVPSSIAAREPVEFDEFSGVSAEALRAIAHASE